MITEFIKKAKFVFWLLPGFLLWASYPPMGEKTDCFFALAPLLWFARNRDARRSFRIWFVNGFLFWFATLSWMPAIVKNGGPWPLVVLGWGALAAYCALYFGAFGWLAAKVWAWTKDEGAAWRPAPRFPYARRLFAILVAEPVLWCGLELVRSRFLGGFAWNHLGLPLVNANLGAPAALGGVYLASAVVVLVNGTIAGIAERMLRRMSRWAALETLVPFLVIWGLYAVAGSLVGGEGTKRTERTEGTETRYQASGTNNPKTQKPNNPITVALVQRNFPCVFKPAEREDPITVYSNLLSNVAYTRPDLVVLPESALCEIGAADSARARAFLEWVARTAGAREVIAGGGRLADGKEYNSAVLVSENRPTTQTPDNPTTQTPDNPITQTPDSSALYDKVHLVPFGEFIPGDKWITALQKLAPVGSCTPGELKLLGGYGVAICFEDTDSAQMRALARMGAKCLVFITNDSWFSQSNEAVQHAWQAVSRAVETGLPVVRVGNSGVTGTIVPGARANWLADAEGNPLVDARGTMCDAVPTAGSGGGEKGRRRRLTPYVRVGDWPLGVAFALLISAMVLVKYTANYEKRRYLSM